MFASVCYRVVPAGYGCISHETRYLPEPHVGIICLSFLQSQLSARAMTVSQGKRSNKSPCKTTTKSTLPSASSKLEKHFTPPIVRGQRVPTACLILSLCGGDRHPSMALFASASPHSTESIGASSTRTAGGANFTHPRVGQAERLACRKRLPNAFCGRKPTPTLSAEKKKMLRCITHQGGESHCIALCAASRETIRVQGSRVPNKPEHPPLCGPCG